MSRLSDFYKAIDALRNDGKLPISEGSDKHFDDIEENIIKEELVSQIAKAIEPVLQQARREMVLVIDYSPGTRVSVQLSRRCNHTEAASDRGETYPKAPVQTKVDIPPIKKLRGKDLLDKIRDFISSNPLTIENFLNSIGQDISYLYKERTIKNTKYSCWTALKRGAGIITYVDDNVTKRLEHGISNLLHHNTRSFLQFVLDFMNGSIDYRQKMYEKYVTVLYYNLFCDIVYATQFLDKYQAVGTLLDDKYKYFRQEISEIVQYLLDRLDVETEPLKDNIFPGLELYGCYTKDDIFSLIGVQTERKRLNPSTVFGVKKIDALNTIILFVTLNKDESKFSETTMYDDHVMNEDHFFWQTTSDVTHTKGGEIYINHLRNQTKIILFVRNERSDKYNTCSFHCFGLVNYQNSFGDGPMSIVWKLEKPIMEQYLSSIDD